MEENSQNHPHAEISTFQSENGGKAIVALVDQIKERIPGECIFTISNRVLEKQGDVYVALVGTTGIVVFPLEDDTFRVITVRAELPTNLQDRLIDNITGEDQDYEI